MKRLTSKKIIRWENAKTELFIYAEAVVWRFSVKKVFLKISQNSQRKNLCWRLFFSKVAGLRLYQKGNSGTGFFLWILRNFSDHFFYRTHSGDCFEMEIFQEKNNSENFHKTNNKTHLIKLLKTNSNTGQKQPPDVFYEKKLSLKISQNSQENTCAWVSFW